MVNNNLNKQISACSVRRYLRNRNLRAGMSNLRPIQCLKCSPLCCNNVNKLYSRGFVLQYSKKFCGRSQKNEKFYKDLPDKSDSSP